MPEADFETILRTLNGHGVEFLVVGGVAAVLHGSPINTFDLDVVHRRTPENVQRLEKALHALGAIHRFQTWRQLRPNVSHLEPPGHQLLTTTAGDLDVLETIGESLTYEDLVGSTDLMQIGDGFQVSVLQLDRIIAVQEQVSHEKDLAALPILRRTLEERRRREASASGTKP